MDFDRAAERLRKDQSKLKRRGPVGISEKAKREAQLRKEQQEKLAQEREQKRKQQEFAKGLEEKFNARYGGQAIQSSPTLFKATSIHGDGDKIALPPSVLAFLSQHYEMKPGSPWTFRIAIPNPDYAFPASPLIQNMQANDDEQMSDDEEEDHHDDAAFLHEIKHKYYSYTHGTVVEFTQEEGHIGLPEAIARALIKQCDKPIPTYRTVDPAFPDDNDADMIDHDEEKTPGHLAWGAFDVPDLPIEVTLVQLPKGTSCTLTPTMEAIRNGFYNLKDIKLVLEQSLIRTRATLSLGDTVHTWHRGQRFDLHVSALKPEGSRAVLCINTDIEVEFGSAGSEATSEKKTQDKKEHESKVSEGRTLGSSEKETVPEVTAEKLPDLKPEPLEDQVDNVCVVQIRADGAQGKRRFDVKQSSVGDLFAFANTITTAGAFKLVTRFPRRVFTIQDSRTTLIEAGISAGQELFLVERS